MLESKDSVLVATSIVLAVSTVASVSVEIERQLCAAGRLSISKWLFIISAFFGVVFTSIVCAAAANGLGASITTTDFVRREALQKLIVAAFPPYFLCNMFVKHAWLTFYYGLCQTRLQRWFVHFMQVLAAGFGISSVFVILLQCLPLHAVWQRNLEPRTEQGDARCIDLMAFFYFNSVFMIINDIVMYLIPIALLWKVDMIRDQRWSLYTLFGICFVVILASIFRLVAIYEVDTSAHVSENYALIFLWAGVENHVGICAACAGALKIRCLTTYKRVRQFSIDLKHKSRLPMSPSNTERRKLTREGRPSFGANSETTTGRSESNASSLNGDVELVEAHPGVRMEVVEIGAPKVVQVRYSKGSSSGM